MDRDTRVEDNLANLFYRFDVPVGLISTAFGRLYITVI